MTSARSAVRVHVTGIVQGVGYRPFVYTLAHELGLAGWVLNASDGVHAHAEGDPAALDSFIVGLAEKAPAMAVVEHVTAQTVDVESFSAFEIRASLTAEGRITLVSPDIATCPDCLCELGDPGDRRYRYPFINCTNCGPRFTVIADVPYDRPKTSMRDFPMCAECAREYEDPADRRFHAQPDACFVCGPRLYLNASSASEWTALADDLPLDAAWTPEAETVPRPHRDRETERTRSDAILFAAADLIARGGILALKGLGGFHLACDATDEAAVERLRERKHRFGKPLAVMVPDLEAARGIALLGPEEERLLAGVVRPIVLCPVRRDSTVLAPSVAGDLPETGLVLPYTPLHALLLAAVDRPLVMTSGNLSEEPIATGNAEALGRLGAIADGFLLHDREILSRYDDSVMRVVAGEPAPVRRARGYAPTPLTLSPPSLLHVLAAGPEQKHTFTLLRDDKAFVSQHIGDLENAETLDSFEQTLELYRRLFRVDPAVVAHDLHPEYLSTKWALEWAKRRGIPTVGVQHHHAHIVSVMAEHDVHEPVLGIAFDGTGYGPDGTIWGGEVLLCDEAEYQRLAHLRCLPLPGGAAAIRRPARMALGALHACGLLDHPGAVPLLSRMGATERETVTRMIERGVNCPATSSAGRLFDAVAALVGVRDDARYEGEAAIELEAVLDPSEKGAYHFGFDDGEPLVIDSASVLDSVLDDLRDKVPTSVISTRFHRAFVDAIIVLAERCTDGTGTTHIALAGGVFMNRFILGTALAALHDRGFSVLTHVKLPANDGAISLGQAVVARARA